jgi:hypothetical protein
VLEARARAALRMPVDHDDLDGVLARLPEYAGLEAWWMTAEVARELGVDRWRSRAEDGLAALAKRSGEHRESLLRSARSRLEALDRD